MIILGLVILSSIVCFAAGFAYGHRKGFVNGTKTTVAKLVTAMNEEMDKTLYKLIKEATDDVNTRWGRSLGYSEDQIKTAREKATKDYERDLN